MEKTSRMNTRVTIIEWHHCLYSKLGRKTGIHTGGKDEGGKSGRRKLETHRGGVISTDSEP